MNYKEKVSKELENYSSNINVHDLPEAHNYIYTLFLNNEIEHNIGVLQYKDLIKKYINIIKKEKKENEIKILSLGSGNCDMEIDLALYIDFNGKFYCYELNQDMLNRGKNIANKNGISNFEFIKIDINKMEIHENFDIILANHSLHHFVELEHIFNEVNKCMTDKSFFIINDMIGRNGHMFYENTFLFCNAIWDLLPKELKYDNFSKKYFHKLIQWDCSKDGFEGIRAQDILPLLDKVFKFKDFVPFAAITNKFVDRDFGHNFDLNNYLHKELLNMIGYYDHFLLKNKLLKPTQLIATLVKKNVEISDYKYIYFEDPKEAYIQDDSKIWEYFDISNPAKWKDNNEYKYVYDIPLRKLYKIAIIKTIKKLFRLK